MVQKREDDLKSDPLATFHDWAASAPSNHDPQSKSYRRVHLRGTFQHDRQILIGPRGPPPGALAETGPNSGRGGGGGMSSSAQGHWVVTPFVICDGEDDDGSTADGIVMGSDPIVEDARVNQWAWFGRLMGRQGSKPVTNNSNETLSKQASSNKSSSSDANQQQVVWIKRGWIPRSYITKDNEISTPWTQPNGIVNLMAMESTTDTPGTFTPPSRLDQMNRKTRSNSKSTLQKLLWMDRNAMEEMTGSPKDTPLFVEIDTNENDSDNSSGKQFQFPVRSTQEFVGEFTVTPDIHVGYAVTWFGLSGAGMIMTRKLLSRGR